MRGLICDDHPLMREALTTAMRDRWPEVALTEAGTYPAAWVAAESQPDFCLVDLSMPGADPVTGIATLRDKAPDAVVIVITGLEDQALLDAVRGCGVAGLYSKSTDPSALMESIAARLPGLQALEAKLLPPRRRQVLELLAEGLTNKEIAQRLRISPATVKIHVARLTSWLGAANRTDAVVRAQRARLI